MSPEHIVLFVGRDDWQKDEQFNLMLINALKNKKFTIKWEDPGAHYIYQLRSWERHLNWLPKSIRRLNLRLVQLAYGLRHPGYFRYLLNRKTMTIESRSNELRHRIKQLGSPEQITILARSSGGRVSSLIADELGIKQLICIGYPFRNPRMPIEPERYLHLKDLSTPTLILQGSRDEYGGLELTQQYQFSPAITLHFIDTDHNFSLSQIQSEQLMSELHPLLN